MERLEWRFNFENESIKLLDGEVFFPLSEALRRWELRLIRDGNEHDICFALVYEREDHEFIQILYEGCTQKKIKTGWFRKKTLWASNEAPKGVLLEPMEACSFFREANHPTPKSLLKWLKKSLAENKEKLAELEKQEVDRIEKLPNRPIEHWKRLELLPKHSCAMVHDLNYERLIQECHHTAAQLVQTLRNRPSDWCLPGPFHFRDRDEANWRDQIFSSFFTAYAIDIEHWWGDAKVLPPTHMFVFDLPWPHSLRKPVQLAKQIHDVIELPFTCNNAIAWTKKSGEYPNRKECREASDILCSKLPELERLTGLLGHSLRELALVGIEASSNEDPVKQLSPSISLALSSYEIAENALLDEGATGVTDDQAYGWLQEAESADYVLPERENWKRYLRQGRKQTRQNKNNPRVGRGGRSIISADEIE